MLIDGGERRKQALACFVVETLNTLPEAADRLDKVVPFGAELAVLSLEFAKLLFSEQINRPEALALAAQPVEFSFDLRDRRRLIALLDLGNFGGGSRLDIQEVANFVLDVGNAAPGAVAALRRARRFGARFADGLKRGARSLVGSRLLGFGLRQTVGGSAARGG